MDFFQALIATATLRTKQLDELKISKNGKITAHHLTLALEQFFSSNDGAAAIDEEIIINQITNYFSSTAPFRQTVVSIPFEVDIPTHRFLEDVCNHYRLLLDSFESPLMTSVWLRENEYASQARHLLIGFYAEFLEWDNAKQTTYCDEDSIYIHLVNKEQTQLLSNLQRKIELRSSDIERLFDYIHRNHKEQKEIDYIRNLYVLGSEIHDKNEYLHHKGLEKATAILLRNNKLETYSEALKEKEKIIKTLRFKLNNEEYSLFATPASECLKKFRASYGDKDSAEIEILIIPIEELELTAKTVTFLKRANIYFIGHLIQKTEESLFLVPGLGNKIINELKEKLNSRYGLLMNSHLAEHVKEFIDSLIPEKKRRENFKNTNKFKNKKAS